MLTGFVRNPKWVQQCAWIATAILLLSVSFSSLIFAQTATGTFTGTVTDPKGLAMTGATILIHDEGTGMDQKPFSSNDAGLYVAPLLPVGTYDITTSQAGFATVVHKGITLQVGQTVRVDFELPVATQQALVTVTTEVPLLDTEKTEQSQTISENLVNNLPVQSRNWQEFQMLAPGLNPDGSTGVASFHGINALYNNNTVDGASNTSNLNGAAYSSGGPYTYSGDSIREFNVMTSGFGADTGQAAGGAINAVTKSGTSQLHGESSLTGAHRDSMPLTLWPRPRMG